MILHEEGMYRHAQREREKETSKNTRTAREYRESAIVSLC